MSEESLHNATEDRNSSPRERRLTTAEKLSPRAGVHMLVLSILLALMQSEPAQMQPLLQMEQ